MSKLPKARNKNIVVQELSRETLVYDLTINKAYWLNETSSKVFNACGNNETFEDLKSKHKFTDDLIHLTLDELNRINLIDGGYHSKFVGLSRREVIKKVGLATATALPVISAIIAPVSAAARSVALGTPCSTGTDCGPGFQCLNGNCCGDAGRACNNPGTEPCCPGLICDSGTNGNCV